MLRAAAGNPHWGSSSDAHCLPPRLQGICARLPQQWDHSSAAVLPALVHLLSQFLTAQLPLVEREPALLAAAAALLTQVSHLLLSRRWVEGRERVGPCQPPGAAEDGNYMWADSVSLPRL